jgi:hypothetical protein
MYQYIIAHYLSQVVCNLFPERGIRGLGSSAEGFLVTVPADHAVFVAVACIPKYARNLADLVQVAERTIIYALSMRE